MNYWQYLGLGCLIMVASANSFHWINILLLIGYVCGGILSEQFA